MPENPAVNEEVHAVLNAIPDAIDDETEQQPDLDAGPDLGTPEADALPDDWTPPEYVVIGGERIPWEQAESGFMRQSDYTKKTTELAERRQAVEKYEQIMEAWESRPDLRPLIVSELAKEAGVSVSDLPQGTSQQALPQADGLLGQYNPRDSEPEWSQRGYASEMELVLHRQQAALAGALGQVQGFFQQQQQSVQRDQAAAQAAQSLQGYGFASASPEAVKAAMLQTGLNDPEAAYLKANLQNIASVASAPKQAAATKPQSPKSSTGRTFDPNDESLNADDINWLLRRGYVPLPQ